jgi:predicted ArsR family transcriptional regulator
MTTKKRGRGRPRPQDTIRRDQTALRLLAEQPMTRDELAARLRCTSHLAYLALWRLNNDGLVERLPNGVGGRTNRWALTAKGKAQVDG